MIRAGKQEGHPSLLVLEIENEGHEMLAPSVRSSQVRGEQHLLFQVFTFCVINSLHRSMTISPLRKTLNGEPFSWITKYLLYSPSIHL